MASPVRFRYSSISGFDMVNGAAWAKHPVLLVILRGRRTNYHRFVPGDVLQIESVPSNIVERLVAGRHASEPQKYPIRTGPDQNRFEFHDSVLRTERISARACVLLTNWKADTYRLPAAPKTKANAPSSGKAPAMSSSTRSAGVESYLR